MMLSFRLQTSTPILLLGFGVFVIAFMFDDVIGTMEEEPPKETYPADVKLFKKLVSAKHEEMLMAINHMVVASDDYSKQYKMLQQIFIKLFELIDGAKGALSRHGYNPKEGFPKDNEPKEALAKVIENTVFLSEVALRAPDATAELLEGNSEWMKTTTWAIGFYNSTKLYDKKQAELINLVSQELKLVDRNPDYINPYSRTFRETQKAPKRKPKKKLQRGPRLSGGATMRTEL